MLLRFFRPFLSPLAALVVAGCSTLPPPVVGPAPWPDVTIAAFTDPHLYAPALGTSGPAWDVLEAGAFQVLKDSLEVVETAVARLAADRPGVVLVTGDLTKDGERASHELMVRLLTPLRRAGVPVLVIPGNHDVLNPQAQGYSGALPVPVPSVTPVEFAQLYQDFGYGSALDRDPASLSYVAEPVPGLRVLALDTARYEENAGRGRETTGGRIRAASWPWIDRVLDQASRDGVPVVVMMHHALVEKFAGQARIFRDYVVADQGGVQRRLALHGVQIVFTGHFHTLSAAWANAAGRTILDIEDGTLSQFPLGFRRVTVHNQQLEVSTDHITDLPSWAPGTFANHAKTIAVANTGQRIANVVRRAGASPTEAQALAAAFGPLYLALVQGDPVKPSGWVWPPEGLGPLGTAAITWLGDVPAHIWTPRPPDDLAFTVPLPLPPVPPER